MDRREGGSRERGGSRWAGIIPLLGHKNLLLFGLIKPPKKRRQMLPSSTIRNEEQKGKEVGERVREREKGLTQLALIGH